MGDKGDNSLVCGVCQGPARSNGKLHRCDNCSKSYHSMCMKLATVSLGINKGGKACTKCITRATPNLNVSRSRTASSSPTSDVTDTAGVSTDILKSIFAEIGSLKTSVETRFDKFEAKLAEIDGISTRVAANEVEIKDVKRELAVIKERLEHGQSSASDPSLLTKDLEKKNAELSSRLATVSSMSLSISTDLVIGGLAVPTGCNLRMLATAVLSTVHPDLEARDVIVARLLLSKSSRPSTQASSSAVPSSSRPPPILVTVSSRALLEAIIRGKINLGKLHSSTVAAKYPAGFPDSIAPSLININEFLPGEVFKLHRLVRQKAKDPDAPFITFIGSSRIYVRRKKGETATLISFEEDLRRFLVS